VDFEFAGYSDLAFDCADLTEHVSSRQAGIDDQAWTEITGLAGLGGEDQRRFEAAQRTCALRWLAVLWKQRDTRADEFTSQLDRVRRLQGAAAAWRRRTRSSEPCRELPVTMLTEPGLEAFAAQGAGPVVTVADRSWPRDGSRVWELAGTSGERFYLKQHQSQRFHDREVTAYRRWAPALGTGRAPRLLAADPGLRAVLITALPGQIARGPHIPEADEPEIHRQAGTLLRRLHSASTGTAACGTGRVAARADEHIKRAGTLLAAEDAGLVRDHAAHLTETARHLPAVPTHGDAQPKNFLWDPGSRQAALIDFERAEPGLAVRDLVRLEYGAWDGKPHLRDAFLDGYGRALTADEESALLDLAALDAVSAIQWGSAKNDTDIMRRGYRTLARLRPAAPTLREPGSPAGRADPGFFPARHRP
jgi:Phosphotransferase enzyme family